MKNKKVRKSISFILAMAFLFSFGISAFAAEDKTDTVNVDATSADQTVEVGNITTDSSDDDGLRVSADGHNANVTTGDITSYYDGIEIRANNGSSVNITTNGNINSSDDYGIYFYENNNSTVNITVNGNVTGDGEGAYVEANYGGKSNVTITGDVKADGYGIDAESYDGGGSVIVDVKGNVTAIDDYAVYTYTDDEGSATVSVNGNATSDYDDAVYIENDGTGSINVSVGKDLTAKEGRALYMDPDGKGTIDVSVGGNLTAVNDDAIYIDSDGADTINIDVKGNVVSENEIGAFLWLWDDYYDTGSKVNLSIGGNLNAKYGVWTDFHTAGDMADVLVEGTITADHPILLEDCGAYSASGLDLTVWKIVPNAAGNVAETYSSDYVVNTDFEKKIKYIIKLEQPEGATLSATDADGKALAKSHDWDVANEGDRVLLKVDLQKGYKLLGAYNGDGEKLALLKDAAGNYYVDVTKGGGVYLSVELDRETYNVTLDLGEGTLDGHTGLYTFSGKYGDKIILGAPTRAGYRFLYWEGSRYYAGDEYTITENHTLTAVWEKIEDEEVANTDNGMLTHFTAFTDMDTHSGGSIGGGSTDSAGFWLAVVCISMLAAFVGVSYSRKRAKRVHFDV